MTAGFWRKRVALLAFLVCPCGALPAADPQLSPVNRPLPLQGAVNVRDLGGYPARDGLHVRRGVLYRADALDNLTPSDVRVITSLAIATVVDFRAGNETAAPAFPLPVRIIRQPIYPARITTPFVERLYSGQVDSAAETAAWMQRLYRTLVLEHADAYRALLTEIAVSRGRPLLFHCSAGKDRTGLAAAFVLKILGTPMAVIERDYLASPAPVVEFPATIDAERALPMLQVRREYLRAAFDAIDETYGSFDRYAEQALGVDKNLRATLAKLLLSTEARESND